ncbi:MAG: collagen-binding domain-containing protein [Phycisphaerae bacterium]
MNRQLQSTKKRGSAIPLAVVAVLILLAMGTGLLSLGLHSRIKSIRTTSDIAARSAADAGLIKALFEMNEKLKVEPWNGSSLPQETNTSLPNCDAVFSYTVTGDLGSGYTVESTGISGQAQRTVSCTLQLRGPFEAAIFTKNGMELKNSAVVDWFNYTEDDKTMQIGTNSTTAGSVILRNSATVYGDVVVGMGGEPGVVINDYGATVTGDTLALTERYVMQPVTVPEWLQLLPSSGPIQNDTTLTNSAKYSSIDLGNSETVTISGGDITIYITGDITLGNSAELGIENDASLILYLGGDFEGKNSSTVNNETQDAQKLKIYGLDSCEIIRFKNSSDLYGAIYAPNADVVMDNSADMYGSVVSKSFEQRNSATFNYDVSLREVSINDEALYFMITNWHE